MSVNAVIQWPSPADFMLSCSASARGTTMCSESDDLMMQTDTAHEHSSVSGFQEGLKLIVRLFWQSSSSSPNPHLKKNKTTFSTQLSSSQRLSVTAQILKPHSVKAKRVCVRTCVHVGWSAWEIKWWFSWSYHRMEKCKCFPKAHRTEP